MCFKGLVFASSFSSFELHPCYISLISLKSLHECWCWGKQRVSVKVDFSAGLSYTCTCMYIELFFLRCDYSILLDHTG